MSSTSAQRLAEGTRSLSASLALLWRDLRGLVGDRVELLSLELHRAGLALAQLLLWVLVATILASTAWLALCGAVAMWMLEQGLHWSAVLALLMVLNIGAAWFALNRARSMAPRLALPATRRHLRFGVDDKEAQQHVEQPAEH